MTSGFIKLKRGEKINALIADSQLLSLLTAIAVRADRTTGEAFLGDWRNLGATSEATYRRTKKRAEAAGYATFKATNKGTIAKLVDSTVYDINKLKGDEQTDEQTDEQAPIYPTNKPTTNKKFKNSFIKEIKNMGVDEHLVDDFLKINRKKCAVTERALNLQLKNLGEFIDRGFTAQRVFEVLAENPSWQNIKLKDYFLEALKGEEGIKDVRQQLTDDGWAVGDQSNLQNSRSRLPRIPEGEDRGGCEVHEAHLAAKLV